MANYRVTVSPNFPYAQRIRGGVVVPKDGGYEGELSDEQLDAIQADELLTVAEQESESEPKSQPAPKSKPAKK